MQPHAQSKKSEESSGNQRRRQSQRHFTSGARNRGKPRRFAFHVLEISPTATASNPSASHTRSMQTRMSVAPQCCRAESSESKNDLSPAGDRRESRGALHGIANEAEIIGSTRR